MDDADRLIAMVCAALDGPLAAHGFAAGAGGSGPDQAQVVFCCPEDEFRARHPDVLPEPHEPGPWGCVDAVVDLDHTARLRVTEVRVETERLPELLTRQGHRAAGDDARRLRELPVDQALTALPRLVLLALTG